jgi:hypothetical protein
VQELAVALANQVDADQDNPVPVVRLKKEHYQHKSYGRIYTPVFEVVKWVPMSGEAAAAEEEEEVTEEGAPAARRRRS